MIAGAAVLDSKEVAELAVALLCAMGVRARTVSATCANQAAWVCAFLYQSRWYWLPIWPDTSFAVYQDTIQMWQDGQAMLHKPDVGWEVVNAYKRIVERHLPLARIVAAAPREGNTMAPMSTSFRRSGCSDYPAFPSSRKWPKSS